MARIVSTHSYRGGTGKSNLTANLAATLARAGKRVAVVDTDIQSPGIHVLFSVEPEAMVHTLNDFLWGRCRASQAAHDVTDRLPDPQPGAALFLIPSSLKTGEIARIVKEGYDVQTLNDGLISLTEDLELDYLLIDTHPGLNEETLLSIALSDVLVLILRPDKQDYQGTAVTLDVARRLSVPRILITVNKALASFDFGVLRERIQQTYHEPVAGIIPLSDEMVHLASGGLFAMLYPDHPVSATINEIAAAVAGDGG